MILLSSASRIRSGRPAGPAGGGGAAAGSGAARADKAEQLRKGVEQRLLADRLGQHRIDQSRGAVRQAVPPGRRGDDDLGLGEARRRAHPLGQCFTRKARHHLVDDDEVERVALVKGALQFGHRGEAVIDRNRLDAEAGELAGENAPVHLDIVDDQDMQARQLAGQARGARSSG